MKRWIIPLLVFALCLQLTGCNLLLDDTYVSVKPYQIQNPGKENTELVADSYIEVRQALMELVEGCTQSAVIAIPKLTESVADYYMSAAINYITQSTAMGAYAVSEITYEVGTNAGELAIAVDITYHYNRMAILRIQRTANTKMAVTMIQKALQQCDPDITLYIQDYTEIDLIQLVQDYVDDNPQYCMELPQVNASIYPAQGRERIIVLSFTYRNSREVLRSMQQNVQEVFNQIKPDGDTRWDRYANIYQQLMERHSSYAIETSITPSYSLLRHGVGDSKAFATVYAAICRARNLNCEVVSGTKEGQAWYWNAVLDDGVYYHIDLLRCSAEGKFSMMDEAAMAGYVWDYSAYPTKGTEQRLASETKPTE